jgi:ABC-type transport system involved in multi-copper enzyme maturation permease subunit
MLKLLIRKEILAHLLSYRFLLTLGLFFVLIVSSVQVIAFNYERQVQSFSEAKRAQEEKLKESTDFRSLNWTGVQMEKPPNALSIFAMGLEKEMARSVLVSGWREAKLGRSKYANPLYVLFSAPDLLYIINIVGSLLALLFAFDAVCGEKEEGTLTLIMANAVPRHIVLLAKWIGGYLVLLLSFMVSILFAVFLAQMTTGLVFTDAEWSAFAGMLGVAALYMSVFFALGLMISTLTHRSSTSLVLSFLVWVLLVLVIPNTAPIVARAAAAVPAAGVIASQREAIQREVWQEMRSRMRQVSRDERRQLRDEARQRISSETDKLMADYLEKVDAQIEVSILLARISPSANYVYATAGLAGSGLNDFSGLRQYIQRYRDEFVGWLREEQQRRNREAEGISDPSERQEITDAPVDPDDLPQYAPPRGSLGHVLVAAQTDLLILLMFNVIFFLGAYMKFLRYDLME